MPNTEAAAYYYAAYLFVNAGVQRSDSEKKAAIASLEELARQGVPQAQIALGVWCRHSAMATNDKARKLNLYHEAAYWWSEAKAAREWTACSYLGGLHESGSLNANGGRLRMTSIRHEPCTKKRRTTKT